MTSERAWAQAMSIKSTHDASTKGVSGRTRSHMVSRLDKGAKAAEHLAQLLASSESGASQSDILEARAYAGLIRGATNFEKQSWGPCLQSYSTTRIIYTALSSSQMADVFKDLLSETIDPSIRYAAYQMKSPRSVPIPVIARKAFPHGDTDLVERINQVDSQILKEVDNDDQKSLAAAEGSVVTLTWRSRDVRIEDAAIATAWVALQSAKSQLTQKLSSETDLLPKDKAAAYDEVLTLSQDAADATKTAIDELRAENVSQSDSRMQSLYITRTAVNYEMISWRIGRNRVLAGEHDGALPDHDRWPRRKGKKTTQQPEENTKQLPPGRQIARLKEKVVLYDGVLQSLDTIQELPGVAADEDLSTNLEAIRKYFIALK